MVGIKKALLYSDFPCLRVSHIRVDCVYSYRHIHHKSCSLIFTHNHTAHVVHRARVQVNRSFHLRAIDGGHSAKKRAATLPPAIRSRGQQWQALVCVYTKSGSRRLSAL